MMPANLLAHDLADCALLQINGSLARAAIYELADKGAIKPIVTHSRQKIYTRATA